MALDIFYLCDRDKNKECSKGILCGSECVLCNKPEYAASKDIYIGLKFDEYNQCNAFKKITPKEAIELMNEIAVVAYNHNPDFKEYVNKYMKAHNLSMEETFDQKIVQLYLEYSEHSDD